MIARGKSFVAAAGFALVIVFAAVAAQAVDAPKWVAALHVAAQKMVGLRWAPVPGATAYKVLRTTTPGKDYKEIGSVSSPQHMDKDLAPGVTYYYVLQAVVGAEASPMSEERSVAIPGEKKVEPVVPPAWEKLNLNETMEFGKPIFRIGLFWKATSNPNVVAYNLYRSLEPGKGYELLASTPETRYVDAAVQEGKTYYYVTSSLTNTFEESSYSAEEKMAVVRTVKMEEAAKKPEKKEKQAIIPRPTKFLYQVEMKNYPSDVELLADGQVVAAGGQVFVFDTFTEDSTPKIVAPDWEAYCGIGQTTDGDILAVAMQTGVRIIRADGRVVAEWAMPAEFRGTFLMDADQCPDGTIYVTDNNNHRVLKFDEKLKFIGTMKETQRIFNPTHIQCGKDGTKYIDSFGASAFYIVDKDEVVVRGVGEIGQQVGTFGKIQGITLDGEGNVWVADMQNGTVQVFNPKGDFMYLLTDETLKANIKVSMVSGIAVAPDQSRLYAAFSMRKMIGLFQILPFVKQ